jgi:hypothetical protein
MALSKTPLIAAILQFAGGLRFRQLFLVTAALFLLNLIIPDPIPFIDELILGLLALLFASWKKSDGQQTPPSADPSVIEGEVVSKKTSKDTRP